MGGGTSTTGVELTTIVERSGTGGDAPVLVFLHSVQPAGPSPVRRCGCGAGEDEDRPAITAPQARSVRGRGRTPPARSGHGAIAASRRVSSHDSRHLSQDSWDTHDDTSMISCSSSDQHAYACSMPSGWRSGRQFRAKSASLPGLMPVVIQTRLSCSGVPRPGRMAAGGSPPADVLTTVHVRDLNRVLWAAQVAGCRDRGRGTVANGDRLSPREARVRQKLFSARGMPRMCRSAARSG